MAGSSLSGGMYDDMTQPLASWSVNSVVRARGAILVATGVVLAAAVETTVGTGSWVNVLLVLAAVAGFLLGAWTPTVIAALGVLAIDVAFTVDNQRHFPHDHALVNDLVFGLIVVGAPAWAGATLVARERQVSRLGALSEQLATQREAELVAARLEEQRRIEARIHHRLVEQLGAIALRADGAARDARPEARRAALTDVESAARAGLDSLRQALGLLRSDVDQPRDVPAPLPEPSPQTQPQLTWPDVLFAGSIGTAMALESVVSASARGPATANVAATLALATPLIWRRRAPVVVAGIILGLAAAVSASLTSVVDMVTSLALLVALAFAVGAHTRGWNRAVGAAVVVAGLLIIGLATPTARRWEDVVPTLLGCLLAVVAGALVARWSVLEDRIRRTVEILEQGRDAEVRLAVARKRLAMSRDLHDSVAHALTVVCLGAAAALRGAPADQALATIAETTRTGMGELRRGIDTLDGEVGSTAYDLAKALGVELRVDATRDWSYVPLLGRVLREAVVNTARHAPGARVEARFDRVGDHLRLVVVDDGGSGSIASPIGSGTGLAGLRALLEESGGTVIAGPRPGGGFSVVAPVPAPTEALP